MREEDLSRRDFLERTAHAAGLAGMAGVLPASTLLYEAADAEARRARLPSPRNVEIDHFVVLMMENRSFDHYFGWAPGADASQKQSFRDGAGNQVPTRPASNLGANSQWKGCGFNDPGHGWKSGRAQLRGGFMAPGSGNDIFALSYYDRGQLGFIHQAASTYTLYDRYFCSILSSDVSQPLLQVGRHLGGQDVEHRPGRRGQGRQPVRDDLRPRDRARR